MRRWSRRRTLQSIGAVATGTIAGCGAVPERIENLTRWHDSRVAWAAPMNESPPSIALDAGRLYAASYWGVYAFDAVDGARLWYTEFDSPDDTISYPGRVAAEGGRVYTVGFSELVALDGESGECLWIESGAQPNRTTPRADPDRVYFGGRDVAAFDSGSGEVLWRSTDASGQYGHPTVDDGTVYVGTRNGTVYALDVMGGGERWKIRLGRTRAQVPSVAEEIVYVGTSTRTSGSVVAIDASTGEERWRVGTAPIFNETAPAIGAEAIYLGCSGFEGRRGKLIALDRDDGATRWSLDLDGGGWFGQPIVADGTVYAGTIDDDVYAVDADSGAVRWRFDAGGTAYAAPEVTDDLPYVAGQGHAAALDRRTE